MKIVNEALFYIKVFVKTPARFVAYKRKMPTPLYHFKLKILKCGEIFGFEQPIIVFVRSFGEDENSVSTFKFKIYAAKAVP